MVQYFTEEEVQDINFIGVSGIAKSGKNYLSKQIIQEFNYSIIPLSNAKWFKCEAVELEDLPYEEVFGEKEKSEESRSFLQERGQSGREQYGHDVWINIVELNMRYFYNFGFNNFILTDIRFPNECERVHDFGGSVYRITRQNAGAETEKTRNHETETKLYDYDNFDEYINNSIDQQEQAIDEIINFVKRDYDLK